MELVTCQILVPSLSLHSHVPSLPCPFTPMASQAPLTFIRCRRRYQRKDG